ncbi:unnamed protein product [Diabrotica balteata]|uniref:Uncharacterized protein n=1 Tax=Diabrotica balteata TaxID=107213 RepID=A0A9N9TEU7_DIABA|nr:unnamed protein product [Diabrotica balteata]
MYKKADDQLFAAIHKLIVLLWQNELGDQVEFKKLIKLIQLTMQNAKNEEFWMEIREDFDRLSSLCKELDNNISYIILLSYTLNLFFLLMQLYQSLE